MVRFNYANLLKSTKKYPEALEIYKDVYDKSVDNLEESKKSVVKNNVSKAFFDICGTFRIVNNKLSKTNNPYSQV
jgi:hypothetical protein